MEETFKIGIIIGIIFLTYALIAKAVRQEIDAKRQRRQENCKHEWNGCKCKKCGATRDEEHKWVQLEGKCIKKCSICGQELDIEHTWNGCKCERCGFVRNEGHVIQLSQDFCCQRCGKYMRTTIEVKRTSLFIGGTDLHLYLNGEKVGEMKPYDEKTIVYSTVENNTYHAYIPEKDFHAASFSFKVPQGSHVRLNIMAGVVMSMDTLGD